MVDRTDLKSSAAPVVAEVLKTSRENARWIKKMRKLGASNREIAIALNIPEDSLQIQQ